MFMTEWEQWKLAIDGILIGLILGGGVGFYLGVRWLDKIDRECGLIGRKP